MLSFEEENIDEFILGKRDNIKKATIIYSVKPSSLYNFALTNKHNFKLKSILSNVPQNLPSLAIFLKNI